MPEAGGELDIGCLCSGDRTLKPTLLGPGRFGAFERTHGFLCQGKFIGVGIAGSAAGLIVLFECAANRSVTFRVV
jgi:hypothetical protein